MARTYFLPFCDIGEKGHYEYIEPTEDITTWIMFILYNLTQGTEE